MANDFASGPLIPLKTFGGGAEDKSAPARADVVYCEEPDGAGGLGQIDCDGCDVCGGAGQTGWDDCACCGELFDGGAGQAGCDALGCCVAGFGVGPTVMRVGAAAGADVPGEADGFCAASFGLGFGLDLVASAAAAGGAGPGTSASASGCSGGAW